jgi:transcriptional regulator with XRE-family HTH domain
MINPFHRRRQPVVAEEIRAVRTASGWTQEKVAEELGVLPVEVAAWESGAIAVDPYPFELMRWRLRQAEYEAALPRSGCYWTRASQARLERMWNAGPLAAVRAENERVAHARECTECMRVEALLRDAPPPPEPPAEPGLRGWIHAMRRRIARSPFWVRVPLQTAETVARLGAVYLGLKLLGRIRGDDFDLSLTTFALLCAGGVWSFHLWRRLLPLIVERPYRGAQLFAAGVVFPGNVVLGLLGRTELFGPTSWITSGFISIVAGVVLGMVMADEPREETEEDDVPDGGADEEREVVIPQQAHFWKP